MPWNVPGSSCWMLDGSEMRGWQKPPRSVRSLRSSWVAYLGREPLCHEPERDNPKCVMPKIESEFLKWGQGQWKELPISWALLPTELNLIIGSWGPDEKTLMTCSFLWQGIGVGGGGDGKAACVLGFSSPEVKSLSCWAYWWEQSWLPTPQIVIFLTTSL